MMLSELERQEIFSAADAIGISQKEIQIEEIPDKTVNPDGTYYPTAEKVIVTIRGRTKTYAASGRVSSITAEICQDIERGLFGL